MSAERKSAQAAVDKELIAEIKKTPVLSKYLKARFSLSNGDRPHEMKF